MSLARAVKSTLRSAGLTAAGLASAWCVSAAAQPAHDFTTYRPSVEATKIDAREAPRIDGDLSDAVWAKSKIIEEFYQIEPKGGEPATQHTVARVLYDRDAIYFSFYCYDTDPNHIPRGAKARDTNVQTGDFVRVYLDPGMTRRNGYTFEVNSVGGRAESLLSNNGEPLYEWNTIWAAKAKRVADGWTAEIKVPFRSISYDAKRTDWGFDLYRRMYRISERVRWTSASPSIDTFDITREGTLTGIHDISQGVGLDIQTYAALRYKHEWVPPGREDDIKLAESGNLYYKITPALTGAVTVNPDFSNTPLDERKINTSRFALFFPETRDFFLQDASAFEFGGRPFQEDSNGMPFFSRNVGLVDGVQVPIRVGGKVSGTVAGWNVGAFSALADGLGLQNRQWLSVVRVAHPVFAESKAGLIFTNGDPTGNSNNSVFGGDFQYRNSHFGGDKILNVHAAYLRSQSSATGKDDEYTFAIQFPNEPWYGRAIYRQIGSNFNPALGFVNRTGVRDYRGVFGRLKRVTDSFLQWYDIGFFQHFTTDISNRLQSYAGAPFIGIQDVAGDQFYLNFVHQMEVVPAAFDLGGSAKVLPGSYRFNSLEFNGGTSQKRSWYGYFDIICCDFYDGQALQVYLNMTYRPDDTWEISPGFSTFIADLPSGSVSIYVPSMKINLNFSPDMQILTEAQYDNLSQSFSFAGRYRWEYSPGAEFFAAVGENSLITDRLWHSRYNSQTSQASVRIGHMFRF